MNSGIMIGGIALLLLLGKKKKKKSSTGSDSEPTSKDDTSEGSELDDPSKKKIYDNGGLDEGSRGSKAPSNLAKNAIWVSPDCQKVVFGDGTGEAFWASKGAPTAQKFISANYHDPYEIARLMISSMAPCAIEFPIMEDGLDPMEEEFKREMFNRDFKEVYYLIQFLYDKISILMDREEDVIEFDNRCDVVFVGENWLGGIANRMARFYIEYMYPIDSEFQDHSQRFKAWPLADAKEKNMLWLDNVATAIINRMNSECGIALASAFQKEPHSASSFFSERPGLKTLYSALLDMINLAEDKRSGGLDFKALEKL